MNANQRSIKGDFIGFTLGNIHSSELGLMRVSDGSRYNQDLLPPLQDKKAQVAGRDGEIYFGSQYLTKPIKFPVAFDNMNEESFFKLRRLLSIKTPQYLWFDETPYKRWLVKSASAQNFKWICFDESHNGREKRIYKGEGTLEFNCFNSYATSIINYLDDAKEIINGEVQFKKGFENFEEWKDGSGLRNKSDKVSYGNTTLSFQYGEFCSNIFKNKKGMFIYNAGDIPIKPSIVLKIDKENIPKNDISLRLYSINKLDFEIGEMIISKKIVDQCIQDNSGDNYLYIVVDSKLKMIKGAKNGDVQQLTGYIYNRHHKNGDYLEIPVSDENVYFIEIVEVNEKNDDQDTKIEISSIKYTHQYY